jgi:hypothetical protein
MQYNMYIFFSTVDHTFGLAFWMKLRLWILLIRGLPIGSSIIGIGCTAVEGKWGVEIYVCMSTLISACSVSNNSELAH